MANNKGKKFESRLELDWKESVKDSFIYRLADQMSGYYMTSRNVSDFIGFSQPDLFLLEAKSTESNTFNANFRQYDELIKYKDIKGCHPGVVIWFIMHDAVVWVPIKTFEKIRQDGLKSFNYNKMINDPTYESLLLPSKKLRTFMKTDYSVLVDYYKFRVDETVGVNNDTN